MVNGHNRLNNATQVAAHAVPYVQVAYKMTAACLPVSPVAFGVQPITKTAPALSAVVPVPVVSQSVHFGKGPHLYRVLYRVF